MSGPHDYQKAYDLMIQEVEAEARRRADLDRDTAWKIVEKSFNAMADAKNWGIAKRQAVKKKLLDDIFS